VSCRGLFLGWRFRLAEDQKEPVDRRQEVEVAELLEAAVAGR
jgi:hypothetical protein